MKVLIIDDEPKARSLLKTIVSENCPAVQEIFESEDLPSGVASINKNKIDLVFLDVEMPNYSGVQILDFFDPTDISFQIVFTTAYSEYALKAFELNAISYLLKPLRPKQVKEAVNKVAEKISTQQVSNQLKELSSTLKSNSFTKIALPISSGVLFVKLEEIYYLKADGMYTTVFTVNQGNHFISKPLKYFVELLKDLPNFYRTHRSFLINKNHIRQVQRSDGGIVVMDNNEIIGVAKNKLEELINLKEL